MIVSRSCGWCDDLNPITEHFCQRCGHAAHVARMLCDCAVCALTAGSPPLPLVGEAAFFVSDVSRDFRS